LDHTTRACISPDTSSSIDLNFKTTGDFWRTDSLLETSSRTTCFPKPLNAAEQPSASGASGDIHPSHRRISPGYESVPLSPATIRLDAQLEFILESADVFGLGHFDSLVSAYYCESFAESSVIANNQRLSRNRRLPKVLADIFRSSINWSDWERRGIQEEILKQTEAMLILEATKAHNTLKTKISPLLEAQTGAGMKPTAQNVLNMKEMVQNEVCVYQAQGFEAERINEMLMCSSHQIFGR